MDAKTVEWGTNRESLVPGDVSRSDEIRKTQVSTQAPVAQSVLRVLLAGKRIDGQQQGAEPRSGEGRGSTVSRARADDLCQMNNTGKKI